MKALKHFNLITKHKWIVFKLCLKAGIPFRGLMHDLSKYSPTEFIESAKFYVGDHSPQKLRKQMDIQKHGYTIKAETNIIMNIGMMQKHQIELR